MTSWLAVVSPVGGLWGWGERHRFDQVRVPGAFDPALQRPAQQGTHTTVAVPSS
jgi:hypothetical protein